MRKIAVPAACGPEAALVAAGRVVPIERLEQLRELGTGRRARRRRSRSAPALGANGASPPDLADLRGQPGLRRALEVAAAGGHSRS